MIFKSFVNTTDHVTLLSYDDWEEKDEKIFNQFAYYRDIYIENQKSLSNEFIITTPARAPQNYFRNGYMTFLYH